MPLKKRNHPIYLIDMYKKDLALNNIQRSICRKNQTKPTELKKVNRNFGFKIVANLK